jgi:hypothetical protein
MLSGVKADTSQESSDLGAALKQDDCEMQSGGAAI